jgi:hypothetical protein
MTLRIAGLTSVLICAGCASTPFVSSDRAPNAEPLQIVGAKVAALALIDQVEWRAAEDAIAREFTARGAVGVPMHTTYPNETPSDAPAAREALEREGFTDLVVFRLVEHAVVSPPPYWANGPGSVWNDGGHPRTMAWSNNWVLTNTVLSVETLVYSLRQNRLVWRGQSKSIAPNSSNSVDSLVRDTAQNVTKELERQGLLATPKG